jgi:hypothetical protein
MTVKQRAVRRGKLNLCLPEFSNDKSEDTEIMNAFYDRLEREIDAFASETPNVRRYYSSFKVTENNGGISVTIYLSARLIKSRGEVKLCRRKLVTTWHSINLEIISSDLM